MGAYICSTLRYNMALSTNIGRVRFARRLLMYAIMLCIVGSSIELLSVVSIKILKPMGIFYDPSTVTQNYAEYLALRDPHLGWRPRIGQAAADGTRNDPAFSITSDPCMSMFGDSFTWSEEVDDDYAWSALLALKVHCRVANYGVGGYGTDQAYLRFKSLPPRGELVFLNHLSENIVRNINQYRNLLYPGAE